jgi:hypothetical protein
MVGQCLKRCSVSLYLKHIKDNYKIKFKTERGKVKPFETNGGTIG